LKDPSAAPMPAPSNSCNSSGRCAFAYNQTNPSRVYPWSHPGTGPPPFAPSRPPKLTTKPRPRPLPFSKLLRSALKSASNPNKPPFQPAKFPPRLLNLQQCKIPLANDHLPPFDKLKAKPATPFRQERFIVTI